MRARRHHARHNACFGAEAERLDALDLDPRSCEPRREAVRVVREIGANLA
jgi:hypothetical protein